MAFHGSQGMTTQIKKKQSTAIPDIKFYNQNYVSLKTISSSLKSHCVFIVRIRKTLRCRLSTVGNLSPHFNE